MNIIVGFPPNIEKIRKSFTVNKGIVFTYGNTLYNPDNGKIDGALMVHEETHSRQQMKFLTPAEWWNKYLEDPSFRLSQELEAYQNQLIEYKKTNKQWMPFLNTIADHLSSFRYGNITDFTTAKFGIMAAIIK